jgi:hypothetical protein
MLSHKFKIGQTVLLKLSQRDSAPGGAYIIVKRLPEHEGEFKYQVRNSNEPHERVVRENELRAM